MAPRKLTFIPFLSALAVAGTSLIGLATIATAQGLPGLTIFSGVDRENQLSYRLDNGGEPSREDRYRLRISSKKMELAVNQFTIAYPESYRGEFDPDDVKVKVDGDEIALDEVIWDQENRVIDIYPADTVPAATRVEIILSGVQNPRNIGTHYFNALVHSPGGDVPMARYLGTWIISISNN